MTKRKRGRPRNAAPSVAIFLRLSAAASMKLDALCDASGESRASYCRRAVHEALLRDEARRQGMLDERSSP